MLCTKPKPTGSAPDAITIRYRGRNDYAWVELDQLLGRTRKAVENAVGEPILEANVAPLDESKLPQMAAKRLVFPCGGRGGACNQHADKRYRRPLTARGQRPRRCTAEHIEKLAPPHVQPRLSRELRNGEDYTTLKGTKIDLGHGLLTDWPMSQMGHSRRFGHVCDTSG